MPKTVEISVASEKSKAVIEEAQKLNGLIGLRIQKGASLKPQGDVITAVVTNESLHPFMQLLESHGIGSGPESSITTTEPLSVVSSSSAVSIARDSSEASWEEMEVISGKNSNMNLNSMLLMAFSGIVATIGISSNALHIVVGAMVIAPGFVPTTRAALGAITGSPAFSRGLIDTAKGYAALIAAAIVTTLILKAMGKHPVDSESSYLPADTLLPYWATISATSVIITFTASAAGALLLATNRQPIIAGVMIALALVPSATLTGMGLAVGHLSVAGKGFIRLLLELGIVFFASLLVLGWKKATIHKRNMHL